MRNAKKSYRSKRRTKRMGRRRTTYAGISSNSVNTYNAVRFKQICQDSISVGFVTGNNFFSFTGGNTYVNFATILINDIGFSTNRVAYEKYRITGCTITVNRSFGDSQPDGLFATGNSYLSPLDLMVYPNDTNVAASNNVYYNDGKLRTSPFYTGKQSKYYRFAPGSSSGGLGVGTWNDCSSYSSQQGQVSAWGNISTNALSTKAFYVVDIKLYVEYASYFK